MNRLLRAGVRPITRQSKRFGGGGSDFTPFSIGYRWQPYSDPMFSLVASVFAISMWARLERGHRFFKVQIRRISRFLESV